MPDENNKKFESAVVKPVAMGILIRLPLFMFRCFIAWLVGLCFYLLAMAMTTYDGFPSMILEPIMGGILTGIALVMVVIVGLPLFIGQVWNWWERFWWLSVILVVVGVLLMFLSWCPFRITVWDKAANKMVETFSFLAPVGWLLTIFGIAYCPIIERCITYWKS